MNRVGGARRAQRGGFWLGLIVGLLVGLAVALGVALYIAKVPVPFVDKVGHRSAEQDAAENEKLKSWDPNAGLVGKQVPRPVMAPSAPASVDANGDPVAPALRPATPAQPPAVAASRPLPATNANVAPTPAPATQAPAPVATKPARDPAAILAGEPSPAPAAAGPEAFTYFVQAGAFSSANDAEQQRAKLAIQGLVAKVSEREQSGRTVYRVRLGPYANRDEAERVQERLTGVGAESALVRVERSKQ
ncbi:MAG TPA: SPOR domain-containing protein [Ideonella sp.]|uniref:SPOR domain-containing protein n=1 Tax=Ideonella sp. TaxID=1929293 RepID=UPI002CA165A7|nr:SPOR domain-containing protein [Ideonella sp.]HSI47718.1 SPOR domain-containing protein [Ideonella sp.]